MAELFLPDQKDIAEVISDYLTVIAPGERSPEARKKIIENCEKPFSTLINALEIANAQGGIEELIWSAFLRDIAVSLQQSRVKFRALH